MHISSEKIDHHDFSYPFCCRLNNPFLSVEGTVETVSSIKKFLFRTKINNKKIKNFLLNFLNFQTKINFEKKFPSKSKIPLKYFFRKICFKIKEKFLIIKLCIQNRFMVYYTFFFSHWIFFFKSWTIDVLNHLMNFYTSMAELPDPPWVF